MKLKEYLDSKGIRMTFFAKQLGITYPYLNAICNGTKEPSLGLAVAIEKETKGKVKAKDLVLPKAASKASPGKRKAKPTASASAEDSI